MIFKITTKECKISDSSFRHLGQHVRKIERFLPHLERDLPLLSFLIKKNIDYYHPRATYPDKSYATRKQKLAHFEGYLSLGLPAERLYVRFKGRTIDECVNTAFELMHDELNKYKDKYFTSESEYPNHLTIRREEIW